MHTHTHTHIRAALLLPSSSVCVGVISLNHSLNGANRYIQGTVLFFVVISYVVALDLTVLYTEIHKSNDQVWNCCQVYQVQQGPVNCISFCCVMQTRDSVVIDTS